MTIILQFLPVLEPSHWLSRREALERFPMLKRQDLKGGTVYYDGQMNDTRVCLAVAQTAIANGAKCANHVEVSIQVQ
jgi:glycerol-3-phosphate dehydrogenase